MNTQNDRRAERAPRFRSFPDGMPMLHKREYVRNLRAIRFNEAHGINSGWNERLRDTNHILISLYLCPR